MIDNNQVSSPFGFAMPGYWAVPAVPATAVRTLPVTGEVSAMAVTAGTKRRFADVAGVCSHFAGTDVAFIDGVFPGISAWSPPI